LGSGIAKDSVIFANDLGWIRIPKKGFGLITTMHQLGKNLFCVMAMAWSGVIVMWSGQFRTPVRSGLGGGMLPAADCWARVAPSARPLARQALGLPAGGTGRRNRQRRNRPTGSQGRSGNFLSTFNIEVEQK